MHIVWLPRARSARAEAIDHIAEDNPRAALAVLDRIRERTGRLADHPKLGRIGETPGTRELVLSDLPFLIIYRVTDRIEILDLIHFKQRR